MFVTIFCHTCSAALCVIFSHYCMICGCCCAGLSNSFFLLILSCLSSVVLETLGRGFESVSISDESTLLGAHKAFWSVPGHLFSSKCCVKPQYLFNFALGQEYKCLTTQTTVTAKKIRYRSAAMLCAEYCTFQGSTNMQYASQCNCCSSH